jgi:hypothetical protein
MRTVLLVGLLLVLPAEVRAQAVEEPPPDRPFRAFLVTYVAAQAFDGYLTVRGLSTNNITEANRTGSHVYTSVFGDDPHYVIPIKVGIAVVTAVALSHVHKQGGRNRTLARIVAGALAGGYVAIDLHDIRVLHSVGRSVF